MWRTKKFTESIVVLGSGFAGIEAAKGIARRFRKRADVHVALVDRENHFVFQPLLPEVAAASIAATHVVNPIRQFAPEVDFDCAEVDRIDLEAKLVHFKAPEGMDLSPMPFTHLVCALGTVPNLGVIPGMAAHGLAMKTVGDAYFLRNHLMSRLEFAANTRDKDLRRELLSVVVVGGGFSGVETCAEINDMLEAARKWYPELDDDPIHCVLVSSTERILPALSEKLSAYALEKLRKYDVEVLLKARVASVTPTYARLGDGREIRARTVICTVGDSPHPVLMNTPLPRERGKLTTDEFMHVKGYDNVWAIGDCAIVTNGFDGKPTPATAQFATRQGQQLASNVANAIEGKPLKAFHHRPQGYLASLGHRNAVAEVFGIALSGFLAWWVWRTIYLFKLPGFSRKVRVALDWTLDLMFTRDIIMLQTARSERVTRHHYEPGQDIVRQGETGESFYAIANGDCEVYRTDAEGKQMVIARIGPGSYFGEEALLSGQPRSASVRAITVVDVMVLGMNDFTALSSGLGFVKEALSQKRAALGRVGLDRPAIRSALSAIVVGDRMAANPETIAEKITLAAAARRFHDTQFGAFPVVDEHGKLAGILTRDDLYGGLARDLPLDVHVAELCRRTVPTCYADDHLAHALDVFQQHSVSGLTVVDRADSRKILGLISMRDVFEARVAIETAPVASA